MASSAFKSTTKRGNPNSLAPNSHKSNPTIRKRSQSVSAISRNKQTPEVFSEFSNKRENPLFWVSSTSCPTDQDKNEVSQIARFSKTTEQEKRAVESTTIRMVGTTSASAAAAERGRSVTRNSRVKNGIGRSLSRVRGRSVSRGHCGTYEGQIKNPQLTSGQGQATECSEDDSVCSFQISNWEEGISICSLLEDDEKTIKAFCERMKGDHNGSDATASGIYETVRSEVRRAISDIHNDIESAFWRGNVNGAATTETANIPPDSVNSSIVKSVLDIRREYARKLEESEERARKLQADLAVEEHRGQDYSRILKETLPDRKMCYPQKTCMGRKRSTERKKMSKRLTEEAMAYFDECVSISTFDSSDFSASEDPLRTSTGHSMPVDGAVSGLQGSSSINLSVSTPDSFSNNKQLMHSGEDSNLTANSRNNALTIDQVDKSIRGGSNQRYRFSFAHKPKEDTEPQNNIKNYIKHFERGIDKNAVGSDYTRLDYNAGESDLHGCLESLLFDRVFFRSRVETGSLHLCGGSIAVSFSPFGSVL